ncbi:hypothetical protein G6F56_006317 [Rhizopus delemar]|nr:hypothetical protein G6F56_006317 [Rhizopus delemar]
MNNCQPIHIEPDQEEKVSVCTQESLPLTRQNLSNLNHKLAAMPNVVLERYCQEIARSSVREKPSISPDVVLASPRLLPFPYHNDSLFLPTAEQLQYNLSNNGSIYSSSSKTETASLFSSPPISRQRSAVTVQKCHNDSTFSSTSHTSPDRRSLPARKQYNNSIKARMSNICTRQISIHSVSSSTIASSICKESSDKKPWLKRILKFLTKNKLNRKQQTPDKTKLDQVWFRQYSKNPSFINKQSITV